MNNPEEIAAGLAVPDTLKGAELTKWVMEQLGDDIALSLSVVAKISEKRQFDVVYSALRKMKLNTPGEIIKEARYLVRQLEVEEPEVFLNSILERYASDFELEYDLSKHIPDLVDTGCSFCIPLLNRLRVRASPSTKTQK